MNLKVLILILALIGVAAGAFKILSADETDSPVA